MAINKYFRNFVEQQRTVLQSGMYITHRNILKTQLFITDHSFTGKKKGMLPWSLSTVKLLIN